MPLIQSSAFLRRGTRVGDLEITPPELDSVAVSGPPGTLVLGSASATKAAVSELSEASTAGISGDCMCSFMAVLPELARESGDIQARFVLPAARLFSLLNPRRWPYKSVPTPLAQGYEPA